MKVCLASGVLVTDELGSWLHNREAATALFTLAPTRYERGSILASDTHFPALQALRTPCTTTQGLPAPLRASQRAHGAFSSRPRSRFSVSVNCDPEMSQKNTT